MITLGGAGMISDQVGRDSGQQAEPTHASTTYIEWGRAFQAGMRQVQESVRPLYARTSLFKAYLSSVIPGFLQTPGYARALLSAVAAFRDISDDVAEAVQARMSRNEILHTGDHRFTLLIEESVLRYQLGDAATMAEQLRHLLTAMAFPSVSLGVIPFSASQRRMWAVETFTIFDDAQVNLELVSARAVITVLSEVATYVRAFDELAKLAVYEDQAAALITTTISDLE